MFNFDVTRIILLESEVFTPRATMKKARIPKAKVVQD